MANRPLLIAACTSLTLVSISFFALNRFLGEGIIPCTEPWSDHLVLSLGLVTLLQVFISRPALGNRYWSFIAGHIALILFSLWLGVYAISPLGYASGKISNLRGFQIVQSNGTSLIESNEVVTLRQGAPVGINALLLDENSHCVWKTDASAALDVPFSCDMVYDPPGADHDILQIRVRSSCGLPDSIGRIRVGLLP